MLILPLLPVARRAQTLSGLWLRARCTGSGQPGWPRPRLLVRGCSAQWQLEGLFCAVAAVAAGEEECPSSFVIEAMGELDVLGTVTWRISLSRIQISESESCGKI